MTSKPSQTRSLAKKKEKEENLLLAEEKNRETKYWGGEKCVSSVRDKTFDEVEYFVSWGEKGKEENILESGEGQAESCPERQFAKMCPEMSETKYLYNMQKRCPEQKFVNFANKFSGATIYQIRQKLTPTKNCNNCKK